MIIFEFFNYKRIDRDGYKLYFSNSNKCKDCPLLKQCTKSENHTKIITRHIWQENLDVVDDLRFIDTIKIYIQ
ncbi:transposase [Macrococcus armenti]|uniref:transposase n=1 Tax=Macrococcus armenti TaxID=2875764 RepID=UPI003B97067A